MTTLLEVKNLNAGLGEGDYRSLLDQINFTVKKGEAIAVVGESGCGKSMTYLFQTAERPDHFTR